jgi:hypothetical protein
MINFPEFTGEKIMKRTSAGKAQSQLEALPAEACRDVWTQVHQIVGSLAPALSQANPARSGRADLLRCANDGWHGPCVEVVSTAGRKARPGNSPGYPRIQGGGIR